jgi:hypothetical protein
MAISRSAQVAGLKPRRLAVTVFVAAKAATYNALNYKTANYKTETQAAAWASELQGLKPV